MKFFTSISNQSPSTPLVGRHGNNNRNHNNHNPINSLDYVLSGIYNIWLQILLCLNLTIRMFNLLRHGTWTWIHMLSRLLAFTAVLAPGWYKLLTFWMFNGKILRNVSYTNKGITSRNFVDIYLPYSLRNIDNKDLLHKKYPVIIFVSGGAWIIGHKLWSALVARSLSGLGDTIVLCPDYRNAPQGDIDNMMDDITGCIKWTIDNIAKYHGDRDNIILAGQSAGAHICMNVLVDAFERLVCKVNKNDNIPPVPSQQSSAPSTPPPTPVAAAAPSASSHYYQSKRETLLSLSDLEKIKLCIGISGPYNLKKLEKHLHRRGLDASILHWICKDDVERYSPTLLLQKLYQQVKNELTAAVPPVSTATAAGATAEETAGTTGTEGGSGLEDVSCDMGDLYADNYTESECMTSELSPMQIPSPIEIATEGNSPPVENHAASKADSSLPPLNNDAKSSLPPQKHTFINFPRVCLLHGSVDASVPCKSSIEFADTLRLHNIDVTLLTYDGLSHTDLILEGPLAGDNRLLHDINEIICQTIPTGKEYIRRKVTKYDEPLAPKLLIKFARKLNPF